MSRKVLIPFDMNGNEIRNHVLHLLGTDPTPAEGQIWYNSASHLPKWYDGTSIQVIHSAVSTATANTEVLRDGSGDFAAHDITANKVTGLATPSGASDAATKSYVDNAISGLSPKTSVRAATTANGTLSTAFANGQTLDGVVMATGDRILLKNQTDATVNGIYTVNASGAPTRATDADTGAELAGAYVLVTEGTANKGSGWVATFDGVPTIGTDNIVWTQFSSAATVTAGNGISVSGNQVSAVGTSNRITVSGGTIDIDAAYVGQTSITTLGTVTTGTWNGTTIAVAHGGTGATTAAGARTALGCMTKYSALIGNGSSTTITVTQSTHGCASNRTNTARVSDESSGAEVMCDITYASNGDVSFIFAAAPTSNQYRIVIMG